MREGTPVSKLAQAIRSHGYNEFDRFDLATVTSVSPTLVKVDGMSIVLDAFDLVIAEHLTDRTVIASIDGGEYVEVAIKSPLKDGDRVVVASMNGGNTYVVIDKAVMI